MSGKKRQRTSATKGDGDTREDSFKKFVTTELSADDRFHLDLLEVRSVQELMSSIKLKEGKALSGFWDAKQEASLIWLIGVVDAYLEWHGKMSMPIPDVAPGSITAQQADDIYCKSFEVCDRESCSMHFLGEDGTPTEEDCKEVLAKFKSIKIRQDTGERSLNVVLSLFVENLLPGGSNVTKEVITETKIKARCGQRLFFADGTRDDGSGGYECIVELKDEPKSQPESAKRALVQAAMYQYRKNINAQAWVLCLGIAVHPDGMWIHAEYINYQPPRRCNIASCNVAFDDSALLCLIMKKMRR